MVADKDQFKKHELTVAVHTALKNSKVVEVIEHILKTQDVKKKKNNRRIFCKNSIRDNFKVLSINFVFLAKS